MIKLKLPLDLGLRAKLRQVGADSLACLFFARRKGSVMGRVFGDKPKKVMPPPLPEPIPMPEVSTEVEDTAKKKARRRKGYAKTIIIGSLEPAPKKRTVLG